MNCSQILQLYHLIYKYNVYDVRSKTVYSVPMKLRPKPATYVVQQKRDCSFCLLV